MRTKVEQREQRRLRLELLHRMRADHPRKAAEQLGHGKAEDQAIEGEEEAEAVDGVPPRARVSRSRAGG